MTQCKIFTPVHCDICNIGLVWLKDCLTTEAVLFYIEQS